VHLRIRLGEVRCKTPEEFKAWSQNLGHEKVLTTFLSYGEVTFQRQKEIIHGLAMPQKQKAKQTDATEIAEAVLKGLREDLDKRKE
jgi:integrase/recombinase XerD